MKEGILHLEIHKYQYREIAPLQYTELILFVTYLKNLYPSFKPSVPLLNAN